VVLNMGEPTQISFASGNLSWLDLAMHSPAISVHFM
jgi:hypothetical protein